MKVFKKQSALVLALLALPAMIALTTGCGGKDAKQQATSDTPGQAEPAVPAGTAVATTFGKAPDFDLLDLDGKHVRLSDYKGQVVIVDFWATWCPPCKKAMPHLQAIHERYGDKGIKILAISTDRDGAEVVKPFIEKAGYTFKVLLIDERVHLDFGGVQSIPTTFIISPTGMIVEKFVGYRDMGVYLAAAEKAKA